VPERAALVPPPSEELHARGKEPQAKQPGQNRTEQNRSSPGNEQQSSGGSGKGKGKGTHAAVVADGEGVAAAGDDGGDGVGGQRLHAVGPVLLLVPSHAQLSVLPGTPAQNEKESNQFSGRPAASASRGETEFPSRARAREREKRTRERERERERTHHARTAVARGGAAMAAVGVAALGVGGGGQQSKQPTHAGAVLRRMEVGFRAPRRTSAEPPACVRAWLLCVAWPSGRAVIWALVPRA